VAAALLPVDLLAPGTDLRLSLNIFDISVALKAQVKYIAKNLVMGVEFQEIRQGDRPLIIGLSAAQAQNQRASRSSPTWKLVTEAVESGGGGWINFDWRSGCGLQQAPS